MTKWTKEPPTESGWYYGRETTIDEVVYLNPDRVTGQMFAGYGYKGFSRLASEIGGEWWPEPIQPPMTDEKGDAG